jgi:hypothetical protein
MIRKKITPSDYDGKFGDHSMSTYPLSPVLGPSLSQLTERTALRLSLSCEPGTP